VATDVNNDGRLDLFVANDTAANLLFVNRQSGWFEQAVRQGVAYGESGRPRSGMGVDAADFDGDGWQDLVVANIDHEMYALYRNERGDFFTDVARDQGLSEATRLSSGWGLKFFDVDNDRHFLIGVMSRDFGPFAVPFSIGGNSYSVESIDAEGKDLTLRGLGPSVEQPAPGVGHPAPDFRYTDVQGRPVALSQLRGRTAIVYFWASWCGGCKGHADALRALYQRYDRSQLEILGVSNDSDRGAMQRFRTEHGHTWPTSFTGGFPAEDPVGRLYREMGSGVFYIVSPDGQLVAKEYEVDKVEGWLASLIAKPTGALGSRP